MITGETAGFRNMAPHMEKKKIRTVPGKKKTALNPFFTGVKKGACIPWGIHFHHYSGNTFPEFFSFPFTGGKDRAGSRKLAAPHMADTQKKSALITPCRDNT